MSTPYRLGRVLIIAGSDSGGGAGIQADIKTVTLLGGYAATAITALTAQNTLGVWGVEPVSPGMILAQARAVLEDIGADVIKTGMLGDAATIAAAAEILVEARLPVVVDPVMMAKGGASLLAASAMDALRAEILPRASLLTPNAPEAKALTGLEIRDLDDMRRAADRLLATGARSVLLKGGHLEGETVTDLLVGPDGETTFSGPRVHTRHTHGTGCTLASACAVGLAQGLPLPEAVGRAWAYVAEAIRHAPGLGQGAGPLGHGWVLR